MKFNLKAISYKPKANFGFTLLELLLAIAIIALLFAVTVIAVNPARRAQLARDAIRQQDVSALSRAIEAYYIDNLRQLPAANGSSYFSNMGATPQNADGSGWIPENLVLQVKTLPIDPLNNGQYFYRYYADTGLNSNRFKIDAALEANTNAAANDGGIDPNRFEVGTDKTLLPP